VVVPGFGKHPVSDRTVYGPAEAVRIWVTECFSNLESHVQWMQQNDPGWAMHSERFLNYTIFPAMRQALGGAADAIVEHPGLCFFARSGR